MITQEDAARFWEKVAIGYADECWWFRGAQDERGVGQFWFDGRVVRAPQFAWMLANRQGFPEGMVACHRCDNPSCCNPGHIWPGTHDENMQDMVDKGRQPRGETHGGAKITEDDVRAIRATAARGDLAYEQIGEPYGLSKWQISNIVRRLQWGHVSD